MLKLKKKIKETKVQAKDLLLKRVLDDKCPISDKPLNNQETELIEYTGGKVSVIKKYIKFRKDEDETSKG